MAVARVEKDEFNRNTLAFKRFYFWTWCRLLLNGILYNKYHWKLRDVATDYYSVKINFRSSIYKFHRSEIENKWPTCLPSIPWTVPIVVRKCKEYAQLLKKEVNAFSSIKVAEFTFTINSQPFRWYKCVEPQILQFYCTVTTNLIGHLISYKIIWYFQDVTILGHFRTWKKKKKGWATKLKKNF